MRGHSNDLNEWGMCGAPHPDKEGIVCNRGLRHPGEHRDTGPDTPVRAATVWERWPRETRIVRRAKGRVR